MPPTRPTTSRIARRPARRAFTLVEMMVVAALIGILAAMAAPSYQRAIEQARADVAAANLRAIWAAERLYWLENHTYTTNLSKSQPPSSLPGLVELGLLDKTLPLDSTSATYKTGGYYYTIDSNPTSTTFTARATHMTDSQWSGSFTIDQNGVIPPQNSVTDGTCAITPGFQ
jgi:prepilin-type N-terminal cleavage/methylation domain-containing protein